MSLEVLTLNQLRALELPQLYYLARPILPAGGFILMLGDEKTFKSYLSMTMGYQMATGQDVLGRFPVPKPLSVLYVEMEVGQYELKVEREPKINRIPEIGGENFHVVSRDMRIQLDTQEGFLLLQEAVEQVNPSVLILDPIVEFHSHNENLAMEMKEMLQPLRKLIAKRQIGMIMCHHNAKMSEYRPGNNPRSGRGAYLAGAANTIINITKPVVAMDSRIQLDFTLRSARKPPPLILDFNDEGGFTKV